MSKRNRKRGRPRPTSVQRGTTRAATGQRGSARAAKTPGKRSRWTIALWVIGALVAAFIVIQFVPYGRANANPPVVSAFKWTSPQAEAIAKRSCYDCHSNESRLWWAVKIAPFSWLAQHDITDARRRVNFSDWNGGLSAQGLQYALDRNMPPLQYTLMHPSAKLSAADKQTLVNGFTASLAAGQAGATVPTPAPSSTAAASGAAAIINARCGTCHSAAPVQQFRATSAAEAKALIDQMVQQGATVTAAEEQALIKYFTR